jgi:hypothetical protein
MRTTKTDSAAEDTELTEHVKGHVKADVLGVLCGRETVPPKTVAEGTPALYVFRSLLR